MAATYEMLQEMYYESVHVRPLLHASRVLSLIHVYFIHSFSDVWNDQFLVDYSSMLSRSGVIIPYHQYSSGQAKYLLLY